MKFSTVVCLVSVLTTAWAQANISQEAIEATLRLPPCVTNCGLEVLPKYNCTIGDECYCAEKGKVGNALAACVLKACPNLADGLEGVKSQALVCNYRTDRSVGYVTLRITYALFGVATVFLFARFLSRWPRLKGAGLSWDDGVVLLCYIPVIGITITATFLEKNGAGRDMWTLEIDSVVRYAKWFYTSTPIYITAVFCTKLSLVLLYLRIWPRRKGDKWSVFHVVCYGMIFLLIGTTVASSLAVIFACNPFANAWRLVNRGMGTCIDRVALIYACGALNIVYDIIVIVLPVPRLLRLNVSLGQKAGIISCFMVGFLVTACSIIRMTTVYGFTSGRNITWEFNRAGFWSVIEIYVSMICCCMPAMAGLLKRGFYRAREGSIGNAFRRSRGPGFNMVSWEKSRDDTTTMTEISDASRHSNGGGGGGGDADSGSGKYPRNVPSMSSVEPLQEAHLKA